MSTIDAPKGVKEYLPPESAAFLAVRDALSAPLLPRDMDTSSCQRSNIRSSSSAESVSRPMLSARRCTPSTTVVAVRCRCAPKARAGVMRAVIETRARPRRVTDQALVRRAVLPRRENPQLGPLPAVLPGRSRSRRRRRSRSGRRGPSRSATTGSGHSGITSTSPSRSRRWVMRNAGRRIARSSSRSWTRSTSTRQPAPRAQFEPRCGCSTTNAPRFGGSSPMRR